MQEGKKLFYAVLALMNISSVFDLYLIKYLHIVWYRRTHHTQRPATVVCLLPLSKQFTTTKVIHFVCCTATDLYGFIAVSLQPAMRSLKRVQLLQKQQEIAQLELQPFFI